ncbi:MAG: polyprenyl synthetase family protein [Sulfolobales archaeon]
MSLEEFTKQFIPLVERVIDEIVSSDIKILEQASKHLIKAGGKRLRPLMLGLFARAFRGDLENAAIAGAAVEILHNFTLVHDDIMDRDQFRRGVPTTHVVYGEPMAILAGDYLYAKAFRSLLRLRGRVSESKLIRIIDLLDRASEIVAEGQALDLTLPSFSEVSEEQCLDMIYRKTSSLFIASAGIGVLLGESTEEDLDNSTRYAENAGIAFQIRDDVLGLLGDPSVTGKPVLNDLREGKRTIMVIHTLRKADEKDRTFLLSVVGNKDASIEDLMRARDLIISYGGVEIAEEMIKLHLSKALSILERLRASAPEPSYIDLIRELTVRLAYREK